MRSEIKWKNANLFNPFLVPIYTTWKHQIAIGFLLFPGGIKWGINPKWVKWKPKFLFWFHDAFNILHDRMICYITLSQMWNGSTALHCFLLVQPISCYWFLSLQHENIRKPEVFLCFQGGTERDLWYDMSWKRTEIFWEHYQCSPTVTWALIEISTIIRWESLDKMFHIS